MERLGWGESRGMTPVLWEVICMQAKLFFFGGGGGAKGLAPSNYEPSAPEKWGANSSVHRGI